MSGVTAVRDGAVLRVAIEGRVTGQAISTFEALLEAALADGSPYAVLFDRRAMTAPTAEGRAALDRWADTLMPRVAATCAGWADVYDERRARSFRSALEAAAAATSGDDERPADPPAYPHELFDDMTVAETWLLTMLRQRQPAQPPDTRSAKDPE